MSEKHSFGFNPITCHAWNKDRTRMSDVSLCIVRVEKCYKSSVRRRRKGKETLDESTSRSSDGNVYVRGLREVCDIKIENYVPQKVIVDRESDKMDMSGASCVVPKSYKESITFVSGNPFVEVTKGIIHLFKENERTDIKSAAVRSQTVCILAIPSMMTCGDVLSFTASFHHDLKHLRIVKGNTPNQYMALLTFRTPEAVEQFYSSYNGVPFNSLEPESCCNLVFVSRVETLSETDGGGLAPAAHTELPTCPVCLERMDESVDGILTIMCNHSFHGECLGKWGDTSCPVCRYVQTPEPADEGCCLQCKATESLWICLICGHVGCGRYLHGHAYQHYVDTHHCYSMQIGTNRVWDYVGDNFVHRLLQNGSDGKIVEGPSKSEKDESQNLEFTYLLSSQLESQRQYYEELIDTMELRSVGENTILKEINDAVTKENQKLIDSVKQLQKEKNGLDKKVQNMSIKLNQTQKDLQDEKNLTKAMQKNVVSWQDKVNSLQNEFEKYKKTKDYELGELKEQLRDVMFYFEAEKTIAGRADKEEIQQGRIEINQPSTSSKQHRKKNKH